LAREAVVCHVTSVHVPTDGRILYHECRSLAKRYRTVLVCRDDGGPRKIQGVEIRPLPCKRGRLARFLGASEIVGAAEHVDADLYHFHDPELLPVMRRFARRTGKPIVYDAHEHYPDAMDQKAWIPAPLRPLAAAFADHTERAAVPGLSAVVVADAALKERFAALHGRVVELDNYPPLSLFGEPHVPPPGPPTMMYVGSISAVRGFYDMIATLELVRADLPDARLVVYGSPTEEVAGAFDRVMATLPDGALELRGPIAYEDVPAALGEANVGLSLLRPHPKYHKNVSTKVFDYMAGGVPYVASSFHPLRAVTGGVGGELVRPGDPVAAAQAVFHLLSEPLAAQRTGLAGRRLVEERLNWESMEERLFGLYETLLA